MLVVEVLERSERVKENLALEPSWMVIAVGLNVMTSITSLNVNCILPRTMSNEKEIKYGKAVSGTIAPVSVTFVLAMKLPARSWMVPLSS